MVSECVLKAPFPWFGGKSKVASLVWERFGDTPNYIEPFFGSGAVLLGRPHEPHIETINDKDCLLANFWRAVQHSPDETASWADHPVNEADLHARHLWLVAHGKARVERVRTDPDYFDCKIAGWWVWGLCQWIGSGWCFGKSSFGQPFADGRLAHERLPHLGGAGRGVHRPSQKLPHLGDAGMGDIYEYFAAISDRLRRVRVCCGNWDRVCGPTPTFKQGLTAVFLDPPYPANADRDETLYSEEDLNVANDVAKWAVENGENKLMRIAFCGYEGSHTFPASWECVAWKARGGYASQGDDENVNATRERVWFSPHCIKPNQDVQHVLF